MPHFREVQKNHPYLASFLSLSLIFLGLALAHFALWFLLLRQSPDRSWFSLLSAWDAGWYLRVASEGYDAASSAFLPLYPALIRGTAALFSWSSREAYLGIGIVLSFLLFFGALYALVRLGSEGENVRELPLSSRLPTLWGLILLIASPASYVFHTLHTESLFLFSSVLAFLALSRNRLFAAAAWAGVAALVRHQGVFLAIGIAVGLAIKADGRSQSLRRFVSSGLISASFWALTPLLHLWQGRSAFPALDAHNENWFVADGLGAYFKTFVFANPIQNLRPGSILHHLFFFALVAGTVLLLRRRRWAEGTYVLLSLAVLPMQGELVDSFRFGAVLFPLFFLAGEYALKLQAKWRWLGLFFYFAFNMLVAWQYGNQRWAY